MTAHLPITIGDNSFAEFDEFCKKEGLSDFFLVADKNTFCILGERVLRAIEEQDLNIQQ